MRILNPSDFKTFVSNVNSGTNYSSTTVLLESDLSLSDITESIGKDYYNFFLGTFDGQGYIISNLATDSSSYTTGLFGYSKGLAIKNVVLDSSCSITSSYSNTGFTSVYVGGLIGKCYSYNKECIIDNSVNIADVTFSGISSYSTLHLGGIAGELYPYSYNTYVKNCANYGSVTYSGTSRYSYIGGIVGHAYAFSSLHAYEYIYNCFNHGTITHNGTSPHTLYLGGITGYSYCTHIENCVSAGEIYVPKTASFNYIGSITGYTSSSTDVKYCYYISELSGFGVYGEETLTGLSYIFSYDNATFELNDNVSIGTYTGNSLVDALNTAADYYFTRNYSKWLLNKGNKNVDFTIGGRTNYITMNSHIVLLPNPASEENTIFEWYTDSNCMNLLKSFEVIENTELYGRFERNIKEYTITFNTRREGVSVAPITVQFGTIVSFPSESIRDDCSVAFWETDYGDDIGLSLTMPAHNFTLYAVWKCIHITTLEDFIDISRVANSEGDKYAGTTVYLDSDLSFSGGTLEPINYFHGVFDGQGHIISDLKMNSTSDTTGLFGHSNGLTIRNVVLDSSCSINNSYSTTIGGIIGGCYASSGECNVENSVNMATVLLSGNFSKSYVFLGGIAGYLSSSPSHEACVKNCVNYGSVTRLGNSENLYIGGIVGHIDHTISTSGSNLTYIKNCLNYGLTTHNGIVSNELYIGGIIGYGRGTYINNCVSAGEIFAQGYLEGNHTGSIVGYADGVHISYCYYTNDVNSSNLYGKCYYTPITEGTPTSPTVVDSTLISNLNSYASNNRWNKWLLNKNRKFITFKIINRKDLIVDSQIILLPDLVGSKRYSFNGWYEDDTFTTSFSSSIVSENKTLYGEWAANKVESSSETSIVGSSDTSTNHVGRFSPFVQLIYFML